jgi:hypothetical protein
MDISSFRLKRVNPFQGLLVDADTWKDAHEYHRDQLRLHLLAYHKTGIVSGLDVTSNCPPDFSVNIGAGVATDPEGNTIVVPQAQRYKLHTQERGTILLVIQFREIPAEPYQPPEGGQPTRILEAFRIQEREQPPSEPYVELARIDFDPSQGPVRDASDRMKPAMNEINLQFRTAAAGNHDFNTFSPTLTPFPSRNTDIWRESLAVCHVVMGVAKKDLHLNGLRNLARNMAGQRSFETIVEENVDIERAAGQFDLLYLTGAGRFETTTEQRSSLATFLRSGGVIFGDACSAVYGNQDPGSAKEFGIAFNRLAGQCGCKLITVQRAHPLLSINHVFAAAPDGCEAAMLLAGGNVVYSGSDYGCTWEGGHRDKPMLREQIRNALEFGANLAFYAFRNKGLYSSIPAGSS